MYSLEELKRNLVKIEHQLLYYLIMEQKETNRLLQSLQPQSDATDERETLVKKMYELQDRPRGWNKWSTEKMADYLKEVS
jgi:FtsZ-binding cell division protein ZapB